MRAHGWMTLLSLGFSALPFSTSHAGLDTLDGPTVVYADPNGCFAFDYTFTVGPGGTEIAGVLLGGNANTTVPSLVIDYFCLNTFPEGDVFVYPMNGCLVDPMQPGLVSILVGTCSAGAAYMIDTMVLPCCADPNFERGDCNADGAFNIADGVRVLSYLFSGGVGLACEKACDGNDDGALNIADAVAMLESLFGTTGPLPLPTVCGADPTGDALTCMAPACP